MNGSTMEAAFLKYEEPNVHMQKRDGTILQVKRDSLSDEDWVYVMQYDPSIFSLWIKLGDPLPREEIYLKNGELPRMFVGDPNPRNSLFLSSDGKMCLQQVFSGGWRDELSCCCLFPIDASFFDVESYCMTDDVFVGSHGRRYTKKHYSKSVFSERSSGQLSSVKSDLHFAFDQSRSGMNIKNETGSWLYDIEFGQFSGGGEAMRIRLNLRNRRNSITWVKPSPTRSKDWEDFWLSTDEFGSLDSLHSRYGKRYEEFAKIPRFARISSILSAKNSGAPREAYDSPAATNLAATGSGFFVSKDGFFLTNYHVVEGRRKIQLMTNSGVVKAHIVRIEPDVDLALLKAESGDYATLSFFRPMSPTLGEDIFTIGFPMPDIQGFSPKMTKGVVSSLNGIQDEDLQYQIDASIQPGNSGGPLVNNNGEIVGVIVASLRDSYIAEKKGVIPQNVNYAIKAKHVLDFLDQVPACKQSLSYSSKPKTGKSATDETINAVRSACAMVMVFE